MRLQFTLTTMFCTLLTTVLCSQITVIINPVKDNTIFQESGDESSGAGLGLFAGRTDSQVHQTIPTVVENSAPANRRRALIAFDLSTIPSNAVVANATIELVVSREPAAVEYDMSFHRLLADWGEGTSAQNIGTGAGVQAENNDVTWKYRFYNTSMMWTNDGGDYVSAASAVAGVRAPPFMPGAPPYKAWSSQGLIDDVQSWLDGTNGNFGWILIGDESGNLTAKKFKSREDQGNIFLAPQPPKLTITYTIPGQEPTTSALINETNVHHDWIEIYNPTDAIIDLSTHALCTGNLCDAIGSAMAPILNGNSMIGVGEYTVIAWNKLDNIAGEIVLQSSIGALDTSNMVDYMQYGTANQANADEAVAKSVWGDVSETILISTDTTRSAQLTFSIDNMSGEDTGLGQWTSVSENPTLRNGTQLNPVTLSGNLVGADYRVFNTITLDGKVISDTEVKLKSSDSVIFNMESQVDSSGVLEATIIDNN